MPSTDERTRKRLDDLEWEARTHPRRHATRLFILVVLGYSYPLALLIGSFSLVLLLLALGSTAWDAPGEVFFLWIVGLVVALLLVVAILRVFWVALPVPEGQPLKAGEAPALRALVDDVRAGVGGGVPVHHIHIDTSFNAAAAQRRRFGLFGPVSNYLMIGLPLLIALDPQQLKTVIAHELGHLYNQHNSFGARIYRVFQTWEALAKPFGASAKFGKFRRFIILAFARWYGEYFASSTLALRRLHEYAADRSAADHAGAQQAAAALIEISRIGYRLDKDFWPSLLRQSGREPLPPKDVFTQMASFLAQPMPPDMLHRWRQRELLARTPVTWSHPCLLDRVTALGQRALIDRADARDAVARSSVALLGERREQLWNVCSAQWKAMAIGRWRYEYAAAKQERELAAKQRQSTEGEPVDREWESIQPEVHYGTPADAIARLHEFVARHPKHAASHYALGRLLLEQDDDSAASFLETAMSNGSEFITPALQMLLDYYRDAGRDAEADVIRQRLQDHERALESAKKERLRVSRRDRFTPHGLAAKELEEVRRILYRYPQVLDAYLVRKQVKLFTDKPSYVLAVHRRQRSIEDRRRADKLLIACLSSDMEIPCAVVILKWTTPRLTRRICQACKEPVFIAKD